MVKNATTLAFYGGVNEIGGNKILLQDGDTRLFFDFGMSYAMKKQFYSPPFLSPRSEKSLQELGILPKLEGIYKFDPAPPTVDAVFISHGHLDHSAYLSFIKREIPVYCGETTAIILQALGEIRRADLEFSVADLNFKTFRTGKKIKIGNLVVEPFHVDHSVPGAYGFIIHTSRGSIVYSGDLRLHGPMAHMTREFAQKASESDPIAMISEGTRVCPEESQLIHSESKVKSESNEVVANTSRLVIAAFYSRDIDRFKTFYEIAKNNNRKFVIPLKLAYLLNRLKTDEDLKDKKFQDSIPDVTNDDFVLLYKKRKRTGEFVESDYYKWERDFLHKAVNYKFVNENQPRLIFNLDLVEFTELVDVRPSQGGHFIHSMSEPFSEEDVTTDVIHRWLEHFGLKFHQIHASGHCHSKNLKEIINQIQPKHLMPIHTEYPELFKRLFGRFDVMIVEKGKPYAF